METESEWVAASLRVLWNVVRGMDESLSKQNAQVALNDIEELISSRVLNNY